MTGNSSADVASELASYPRRYCSVCDNLVPSQFGPGPGGRPNASCPRCGSLERQRFFGVLLSVLAPSLGDLDVLGMNFLSQLASWRVEGRTLVLTPHHPQLPGGGAN